MKTKKLIIIAALVMVLSLGMTATVFAILHGKSNTATNTLTPDSDNTPTIAETFANNVKSNVSFTNTADYSVYVRAAVVMTWRNADGEVDSSRPVSISGIPASILRTRPLGEQIVFSILA